MAFDRFKQVAIQKKSEISSRVFESEFAQQKKLQLIELRANINKTIQKAKVSLEPVSEWAKGEKHKDLHELTALKNGLSENALFVLKYYQNCLSKLIR